MDKRHFTIRRAAREVLLALLLGAAGTAWAYDHSETCSTGQTLYFDLDWDNFTATIVAPKDNTANGWEGYTKPTGDILLLPEFTLPGYGTFHVTAIGDYAFYNCSGLTGGMFIPNTVTSIGNYAFYGCTGLNGTLRILNNSNPVGSIGEWAFSGCRNLKTAIIGDAVISIGNDAFYNCNGMTSLTIGNSVTSIGDNAFYNCSGLASVAIPNSVTSIGEKAFSACIGLTSMTLGNSVTSIGAQAFHNCYNLTEVTIPNSVTSIGANAFNNCSGLTEVTIPNSVTSISGNAFYCGSLVRIVVDPENTHYDSRENCNAIICTSTNELITGCKNTIIPNSVTSIGNYAFFNCNGLTSVTIPNSVTSIGLSAFYNCNSLTSLTIGNSVTSIGSGAFYNCNNLTSVTIPYSVTSIGTSAFKDCSALTSVIIGNSVTSIGSYAFQNCNSLTSVIIGNSVTLIGSDAFKDCSALTTITSYALTPPIASDPFKNVPTTAVVNVPWGKTSAYQAKYYWRDFTNYVEIHAFTTAGDWSSTSSWEGGAMPGENDDAVIVADCYVDTDVTVKSLTISSGNTLTVANGNTLTVTNTLTNNGGSAANLVIADGGQLITNIATEGTVQRHIDAFSSANDGWNFIASPVTESLTANFVGGLIPLGETVYDLYYLDEENTYWRNYKQNAFEINHNQGYLYANGAGTTLNFSGTLQPYVAAGVSIPLSNAGDGWNLVGNPFTFNAYADKSYYVINGRNVEAAVSGAIAPCTGIVVKATDDNQTVTFTKENPAASSPNPGYLNIVAAEQVATRDGSSVVESVDNAIVSFDEGNQLEKFVFNEENVKIYIPQGGEDYAIAFSDRQSEMPLHFKAAKNGTYTLTVNPKDVEMAYLHLMDNMTGADIDLLATPSYSFTAKTTDHASRFRLAFSTGSNASEETFGFVNAMGNFCIYGIEGEATVQVIDVYGRILSSETFSGNYEKQLGGSAGIYVIRLVSDDNVRTQKVTIK